MNRKTILFIILVMILAVGTGWGQEVLEVTLEEGQTLRDLAQKHLGNPDDWDMIVAYNGYQSVNEIGPGTTLSIPVELYKNVVDQLNNARKEIELANQEGASILIPHLVDSALQSEREALSLKKQGSLEAAHDLAKRAYQQAQEAVREAKKRRVQAITAVLAQKNGRVETRRADQAVWSSAQLEQDLMEKERVRTLSQSGAQVVFMDRSRINLGENALIVVESMKQDLIQNSQTSSVVVLQGDINAYLSALGQKSNVQVSTPDVETNIRSRNFWTSRGENNETRVANYDGEIDIISGGQKVTVRENEGSKVLPGNIPTVPKKLLPAPELVDVGGYTSYQTEIYFRWQPVEKSKSYLIEISSNRGFTRILERIPVDRVEYRWKAPESGVYYWHVSAVDEDDFPGPFSDHAEISIKLDNTPPYLVVEKPLENEILFADSVIVMGTVEMGSILKINGETAQIEAGGEFNHSVKVDVGKQIISIIATDKAGNQSKVERGVFYSVDEKLLHLSTDSSMVTNVPAILIEGFVPPMSNVQVGDKPIIVNGTEFHHLLPLQEGKHEIGVTAMSASGDTQIVYLTPHIDTTPPVLSLRGTDDEAIPAYTTATTYTFQGDFTEPVILNLNGEEIANDMSQFQHQVELNEGDNRFQFIYRDAAGNVASQEWVIYRDTTPPVVSGSKIFKEDHDGSTIVRAEIKAKDEGVGLARRGRFVIEETVSGKQFEGILTLIELENEKTYEGRLYLPPEVTGKLKIVELNIQDYLGNQVK